MNKIINKQTKTKIASIKKVKTMKIIIASNNKLKMKIKKIKMQSTKNNKINILNLILR